MIYKSYQLDKAYNDNYNFFLFYGKNTYQKNSEFNKLRDEKCEVIKYEEKDLLDKKNEIIENILTKSLFQQKKLILVKIMRIIIKYFIKYHKQNCYDKSIVLKVAYLKLATFNNLIHELFFFVFRCFFRSASS